MTYSNTENGDAATYWRKRTIEKEQMEIKEIYLETLLAKRN